MTSNDFEEDDSPVYVLTNVNIANSFFDDFAINDLDIIEEFVPNLGGLLGANTNVNYESALDADGLPKSAGLSGSISV